ncbi:MAG: hypothetical protein ACK6BG_04940 [Cyanobacteriota bacterium]
MTNNKEGIRGSRSLIPGARAAKNPRLAAHFLLIPELLYSPPNESIINAYLDNGYRVDIYSPGPLGAKTAYGDQVNTYPASYTWIWLLRNLFNSKWLTYDWFSGTSEDPLAVIAVLCSVYGKKSFGLLDEIKAGSYRGDRSDQWKMICKFGIRRAKFRIVNDKHRISLLREYAGLSKYHTIIVYPGCYRKLPEPDKDSTTLKRTWGFPDTAFVIGSSGGFNLTAGADWLLNALKEIKDIHGVIQPLGVSELSVFLLENLECSDRIFIQKQRLAWHDAWKEAVGFDVGLSIYTNPAPQFQKMGISSNRLCMFIAMGVPVIASRQKSFAFLEEFNCGILVETYAEFKSAIQAIRREHHSMQENCKRCFHDYIKAEERFQTLSNYIKNRGRGAK